MSGQLPPMSSDLIASGLALGNSSSKRAAAPATCGHAMEVPLIDTVPKIDTNSYKSTVTHKCIVFLFFYLREYITIYLVNGNGQLVKIL